MKWYETVICMYSDRMQICCKNKNKTNKKPDIWGNKKRDACDVSSKVWQSRDSEKKVKPVILYNLPLNSGKHIQPRLDYLLVNFMGLEYHIFPSSNNLQDIAQWNLSKNC